MLRLRISISILVLFSLAACTQAGRVSEVTATPAMAETQTAAASSIPTDVPTVTPDVLPTISFVTPATDLPPAAPFPADFSPVLLGKKYDANTFFTVLGGVQGRAWISAEQTVAGIPGASIYDVYTFASGPNQIYGSAPRQEMPNRGYFLSTDSVLNETGMIGVAQGWQVTHRVPQELPANNDLYRQVVMDTLTDAGIAGPQIGTMHIYRIDLEGDGTDEIFISDTRVESSHGVVAGDHSVILMRKVSASGAITIPILVDLYAAVGYGNPFPCSYSIANFVDLNRDGVLEVMATYDRWEGFGASVYEVQGEAVEQVLGTTCINP